MTATEKDKKKLCIINETTKKFTDFEPFSIECDNKKVFPKRSWSWVHTIFKNYDRET
jgi:hypothetical protein